MKFSFLFVFSDWLLFIFVIVLDQWTKYLAYTMLELGKSVEILRGRLNLTLVNNPGAAFGLFADLPPFYRRTCLLIVSLLAIWVVIRFLLNEAKEDKFSKYALILILSGAIGNMIDRFRLDYVVDFIDVIYWDGRSWPAFNVADSAISLGVMILMFRVVFFSRNSVSHSKAKLNSVSVMCSSFHL